jgi:hypothetical protein
VKMVDGARLFDLELHCRQARCQVVATVETPHAFEPTLVKGIQNVLAERLGHQVDLAVRSLLIQEASVSGYRFAVKASPPEEKKEKSAPAVEPERAQQEQVGKLLAEQAQMVPGAKLVDFSYDGASSPPRVVATYLAGAPFDPALEKGIENLLRSALGQNVSLELHYVGPLPPPTQP